VRREKDEPILEFRGPLWDDRTTDLEVVQQALVKATLEDLKNFEEDLMAEGLHLSRIIDVLFTGTSRPN
jgi:hypothetical protein